MHNVPRVGPMQEQQALQHRALNFGIPQIFKGLIFFPLILIGCFDSRGTNLTSGFVKEDPSEEQKSPQTECSPKWAWVTKGDASGEMTLFRKIYDVFFSRLPRTLEEDVVIVST